MMVAPLMFWTLAGCTSVQDMVGGWFGAEEAPSAGPPAPMKPVTPAEPLDATTKAMGEGRYEDALAAAEKVLAAHPESDDAWDLVELAAGRAHAAGALLDRLAVDQGIGGRVDRHMGLRARLALGANRPADALTAAQALRATGAPEADAYLVRAVRLGAPAPPDLSAVARGLLEAMADPAVEPGPDIAAAAGVEMARLRAEIKRARGDTAGAAAELAQAAAGPLVVRVATMQERLRVTPVPDAVVTEAMALSSAVAALGGLSDAADVLAAAVAPAASTGQLPAVLTAATALQTTAAAAKGQEPQAYAAAAVAEAALRAGQPLVAVPAATLASTTAGTKARGQWALAMAHAALGDVEAVEGDATGLPGDRVRAVRALAQAMRGRGPTLPSEGLTGDDALTQGLLGLGWLGDPGPTCARLTTVAGAPDLVLWAKLACGRGPIVLPAEAAPSLQAEAQVRTWLATGQGAALADVTHPAAAGWTIALAGAAAPGDGPPIARLRRALEADDAPGAAMAMNEAAIAVPAWRTGPLAPLLVLDGPVPRDLVGEVGRMVAQKDSLVSLTAVHAWTHRHDRRTELWGHGVTPFAGAVKPEKRAAVFDAAARLRVASLLWLLGKGAWPAEAQQALSDAAKAADLTAPPLPALADLRSSLGKAAAISMLELPGGVSVLYLTADKGEVRTLPMSITTDIADYVAGLQQGTLKLAVGDRIRATALDVAQGTLLGVGSFVVVGADGAAMLPVAHLPEQIDGKRFLASIRHVTHVPDFESIATPQYLTTDYPVTALALCANEEEAARIRRHFPDAVVKIGVEATVAAWEADAGKARFLHIGAFPSAPGGGFTLPGNHVLEVGDLAATGTQAMAVVVQGTAPPADSVARAAALRQAGVADVLVHLWPAEAGFEETMVSAYWDGISRRRQATRAIDEGRGQAIKLSSGDPPGPERWGGWLLLSAP